MTNGQAVLWFVAAALAILAIAAAFRGMLSFLYDSVWVAIAYLALAVLLIALAVTVIQPRPAEGKERRHLTNAEALRAGIVPCETNPETGDTSILDEEGNPAAFEPALREIVASHPEAAYITVGNPARGISRTSDVSADGAPSTVCAAAPGRKPRASFARALLRRITGR